MKLKAVFAGILLLIIFLFSNYAQQDDVLGLSDLFLGQKPPGKKAEIFAPEVLKDEPHESPIISQDETWIIIGTMEKGIKFYKMNNGNLSLTTNPLDFDIPEICNGIAISISENRVCFLVWENNDENFYFIEKKENNWTPPKLLGEEVNSINTHWQFTVAMNENLYFTSRGKGILVSVFDGNSHLKPIPLQLEDNSNLQGGTPYISPDESYIIYSIDGDLHISYNSSNGKWTNPLDLGPNINSDQLDICPRISPNGKYLFFNSRRNFPDFVTYWADAGFIEDLKPKELK